MPGYVPRPPTRATVDGYAAVIFDALPCADYSATETYAYRRTDGEGRRSGPTLYGYRSMSGRLPAVGDTGYDSREEARRAARVAECA